MRPARTLWRVRRNNGATHLTPEIGPIEGTFESVLLLLPRGKPQELHIAARRRDVGCSHPLGCEAR